MISSVVTLVPSVVILLYSVVLLVSSVKNDPLGYTGFLGGNGFPH
jgi:hypothetical protein